jgi:hypothetical protein
MVSQSLINPPHKELVHIMANYRITFTPNESFPVNTVTQVIISSPDYLPYFLENFLGYVKQELSMSDEYTLDIIMAVERILDGDHMLGTAETLTATEWLMADGTWHWHDTLAVGTLTWDIVL